MITIYYFKKGQKHYYYAHNFTEALNRKFVLRKQYGIGFSGVGHFHYFENGERQWL
jgi:hypothetical protein